MRSRALAALMPWAVALVLLSGCGEPVVPDSSAAAAAGRALESVSALRCSDRNVAGVGLRADYFSQPSMQGDPLLSRVDTTVEFDASLDWPADRIASRPRAARWQGWVKAPLSGRYRFHGGPHARITVSGLVMAGPSAAVDAGLDMSAGSFYPIVMEVDLGTPSTVRLEWTAPHGMRYVIPRALLFLPTS